MIGQLPHSEVLDALMAEGVSEYLTAREAYRTFATKEDLVGFSRDLTEHRVEDRQMFGKYELSLEKFDNKLDSLRSDLQDSRIPRWVVGALGILLTIGVPIAVVALQHAWK